MAPDGNWKSGRAGKRYWSGTARALLSVSVWPPFLGFVLFYGAGEVWESCNRILSLETILFPYRISCISLLSLPFTKILTYKPMFVLLSSFSLPTYFPSEIMRWTICRNNIFDKYTPFSFSQIIWEQTLIFYYFVHYLKYLSNCLQ